MVASLAAKRAARLAARTVGEPPQAIELVLRVDALQVARPEVLHAGSHLLHRDDIRTNANGRSRAHWSGSPI